MLRYNNTSSNLVTDTQLIHEWVNHLISKGHEIIDASRGKPSFQADKDAIKGIKKSISRLDNSISPYGTDCLGNEEFRNRAAEGLSNEYNLSVSPKNVVFTPGGQFGLSLAFKTIFNSKPDGCIVLPKPWYLNHNELIEFSTANKQKTIALNLDRQENFNLTADKLKHLLAANKEEISAFVFCNPANPTGQIIKKEEWKKISKILIQYPNSAIILDEAFAEVIFDYDFESSLLHASPELSERTFLFRSGTKALGLPGERLAVTVVPDKYLDKYTYFQSRLIGNSSISSQAGMSEALYHMNDDKKKLISKYYKENSSILYDGLSKIIGKSNIIKPVGGFYTLAKLDIFRGHEIPEKTRKVLETRSSKIKTDIELVFSLLFGHSKSKGIALIPGSSFGLEPEDLFVRISHSIEKGEIKKLVSTMTDLVR
jgi:aspartate/methionine/tyrosine aminotransferase